MNKGFITLHIHDNVSIHIFHRFSYPVAAAFMSFLTHHRFTTVSCYFIKNNITVGNYDYFIE